MEIIGIIGLVPTAGILRPVAFVVGSQLVEHGTREDNEGGSTKGKL
jgi:hypothetical protein